MRREAMIKMNRAYHRHYLVSNTMMCERGFHNDKKSEVVTQKIADGCESAIRDEFDSRKPLDLIQKHMNKYTSESKFADWLNHFSAFEK